jgi:hypothetical protein
MLIKIIKNKSKYDDIYRSITDIEIEKEIILNCTLIKHLNKYWIITNLNLLEGYLQEKSEFKLILINENNIQEELIIKNIISFHDELYDHKNKYDCYFDIHSQLVLIRYKKNIFCDKLVDNITITYENMLLKWMENDLSLKSKIININNLTLINYVWENIRIIFPPTPHLVLECKDIVDNIYSGTNVYENNILIGLVNNIIDNKIYITPLFSILKVFDQLNYSNQNFFNIDIRKVVINKLENIYGICICDNYYNEYITKDINNNEETISIKILDKGTIITSIDDMNFNNEVELILKNNNGILSKLESIPVKSYIWYMKSNKNNYYEILIKYLNNKLKKNKENYFELISNKNLIYSENQIIIHNKKIGINLSDFYYINYKNKYIFELNETILFLLKDIFLDNKNIVFLNYIFKNKYNNNKILIGLSITNQNNSTIIYPKIVHIKKYKDIEDIKKNNSNKKLINIILNLLK